MSRITTTIINGVEVVRLDGGRCDYVLHTDGHVYSINGGYFMNPQTERVDWCRWQLTDSAGTDGEQEVINYYRAQNADLRPAWTVEHDADAVLAKLLEEDGRYVAVPRDGQPVVEQVDCSETADAVLNIGKDALAALVARGDLEPGGTREVGCADDLFHLADKYLISEQ